MTPKETNASLKFTAKLVDDVKGNYFTNVPNDVQQFLCRNDGTMERIVENLYPDQLYEIEIKIKSVSNGGKM
jgi:hypothetical protein